MPRVTALLERRLFVEGDEVKQSDLLYVLKQPPFQALVDYNKANVAQLEAQHRNAELTLERAQYLVKTVAGQQSNVDAALAHERSLAAQINAAKAQRQTAEINLGYTEMRALVDGKISATAVTDGNVVSPASGTLAKLVSQDLRLAYSMPFDMQSGRASLDLEPQHLATSAPRKELISWIVRLFRGRISIRAPP